MSPNELTLEVLKNEFKTHQDAIENRVKEIITSNSDEAQKTVTELQAQLKNLNEHVDKMEEEYKKAKAAGLPGLDEELKKKDFSFTNYIAGLYKSHPKINEHDPWKGAEFELECVKEYAKVRANTAGDGSGGLCGFRDSLVGEDGWNRRTQDNEDDHALVRFRERTPAHV